MGTRHVGSVESAVTVSWTRRAEPAAAAELPATSAPPLATHLVDRPRLHAVLDAACTLPVTLVTGPAGWGKTLLVGAWYAALPPDRVRTWITLGSREDEPRAFWSTLARALGERPGPAAAAALGRVLGQAVTEDELPGAFAEALGVSERPIVLVLDDLHEVRSPAVHSGLRRLVERPPAGLSLVAVTRHDPPWAVERLRMAGVLTELGPADLAFDDAEAGTLFARLGVAATREQVGEMVARTGGWAAGLRLAALDLGHRSDVAAGVAMFSGGAHSVSGYLTSEVLDRLSPELDSFLEAISVVDLVCAELADAVTGRDDGERMLAEVAATHLFVQALDRPGRWYRPHRLVLDLLRARPSAPRRLRDRHRRAAEWFRRAGMPWDATRSAVRGGLWAFAAELVASRAVTLVLRGSPRDIERILADVPYPVLIEHPELAVALAGATAAQGSPDAVRVLLDEARRRADTLSPRRRERFCILLELVEGAHARGQGDLDAAVRAFRRIPLDVASLARCGLADARIVPVIVINNLGTAELWSGNLTIAATHLHDAAAPRGEPSLPQINAMAHLALLACAHGELDLAETRAREAVDVARSGGWSRAVQVAPAYLTLAGTALDRDELDAADEWFECLAEEETVREPHVRLARSLLLAARRESVGDLPGAIAELRLTTPEGPAALAWLPPRPLAEPRTLAEARLLALDGHLEAARALADALGPVRTDAGRVAAAALRLHGPGCDPDEIASVLGPAMASDAVRVRVGAGLVAALAAQGAGDDAAAAARLERALLAAASVRLRRPFLVEPRLGPLLLASSGRDDVAGRFARDLVERLADGPMHGVARRRARVPPLTTRERTALRYLAGPMTNAEIAAKLFVSVNTVKTHQRAVYRKLGAEGRRDAVRIARSLALL